MPRPFVTETWIAARCHAIGRDTYALLIGDTGVDRAIALEAAKGAADEFGRVLTLMLRERGFDIVVTDTPKEAGK